MDKIAERLNVYVDTHPFDAGDSDCETVLDQLYQTYAKSHEAVSTADWGKKFLYLFLFLRQKSNRFLPHPSSKGGFSAAAGLSIATAI